MSSNSKKAVEISRVINLDELGSRSVKIDIEASKEECAAIAARLNIPAVRSFFAKSTVRISKQVISIQGAIEAALIRECVASMEEMEEKVAETFEFELARGVEPDRDGSEGEEEEIIEYHDGDELDVGDILIQQLALAMEPFPRKEDAASLVELYGSQEGASPFQALSEAFKKNQ